MRNLSKAIGVFEKLAQAPAMSTDAAVLSKKLTEGGFINPAGISPNVANILNKLMNANKIESVSGPKDEPSDPVNRARIIITPQLGVSVLATADPDTFTKLVTNSLHTAFSKAMSDYLVKSKIPGPTGPTMINWFDRYE